LSALFVPLVVVIRARAIAYGRVPVAQVERHGVIRLDLVHRYPPVDLAEGGGVPRVAMRVEGVGDPRREIAAVRGRADPRDVELRVVEVTAHLVEEAADEPLALGMVNEARLQLGEDCDVVLDGEALLRPPRIERREGRLRQAPCELA